MTTIMINNPNGDGSPPLQINEWLAENDGAFSDPADGNSDDWFEIYNPTGAAVNLAGWTLSDMPGAPSPFVVPAGWTIPAGGFLLVWADNEPVQNPSAPGVGSALHVPFKLASGGDEIQLASPSGHIVDHIIFGRQRSNHPEGRFPDGGEIVTALTLPTPASPNSLTIVSNPVANGAGYEVRFSTTPGLRYTLQRSGDLVIWEDVAPAQTAADGMMTVIDPAPVSANGNRFFRVLITP